MAKRVRMGKMARIAEIAIEATRPKLARMLRMASKSGMDKMALNAKMAKMAINAKMARMAKKSTIA